MEARGTHTGGEGMSATIVCIRGRPTCASPLARCTTPAVRSCGAPVDKYGTACGKALCADHAVKTDSFMVTCGGEHKKRRIISLTWAGERI